MYEPNDNVTDADVSRGNLNLNPNIVENNNLNNGNGKNESLQNRVEQRDVEENNDIDEVDVDDNDDDIEIPDELKAIPNQIIYYQNIEIIMIQRIN